LLESDSATPAHNRPNEEKLLERKKELGRRVNREKTDKTKEESKRKILR
jgi:hypothetical protein